MVYCAVSDKTYSSRKLDCDVANGRQCIGA